MQINVRNWDEIDLIFKNKNKKNEMITKRRLNIVSSKQDSVEFQT